MASPSADDTVLLATVVRPQGRKGEVLCDLHTDFPERFADRRHVLLRWQSGAVSEHVVANHWLPTGRSAGRIVLHFEGVNDISAAEPLAGATVEVAKDQRVALEDGSYYISDLMGCEVLVEDRSAGRIVDVHFPTTPEGKRLEDAAPIFVLERPDGAEVMIPFANEFLLNADLEAKQLTMRLPAGLLEVNG